MTLGSVYFIQEGHNGSIKIGWTKKKVARRLHNLQLGNCRPLTILATIPNVPKHIESEWHKRFAFCRGQGEWFFPVPDLLSEISILQGDAVPLPPQEMLSIEDLPRQMHFLVEWMRERRVTQTRLAELSGVNRTILSRSIRGVIPMSMPTARRIEIATDGAVKAAELLGFERAA